MNTSDTTTQADDLSYEQAEKKAGKLADKLADTQKSSSFLTTRKLWVFAFIALCSASVIAYQAQPVSYDDTLIQIQAKKELGYLGTGILKQPAAIQAQLLSYAHHPILAMQAWLALQKYPKKTPRILDWYGQDPDFQRILEQFGPQVIPVIDYFTTHSITTLTVLHAVTRTANSIAQESTSMWRNLTGNPSATPQATPNDASRNKPQAAPPIELTPEQRGMAAIYDIQHEGNHFIGQFDIDATGTAHWNTTDRITQDVGYFLTSGLVNVTRKHELDEKITAADVGWAAVDALPIIAGFKLLKLGKAGMTAAKEAKALETIDAAKASSVAKNTKMADTTKTTRITTQTESGSSWRIVERTGLLARSLAPKFLYKAAWLATTYIIITHPALLSSLFVHLGNFLGSPAWLSLLIGWTGLLYLLLFPFIWLLEKLIRYSARMLGWLSNGHAVKGQQNPT